MSIETLLAANIKAVEANTEALTSFAASVGAAVATSKKATSKDKTTTTAADPAATSAAPAGAAAGSAAGASAAGTPVTALAATHPLAIAVTAFAKAHGRDAATAAVNKFGGEGRASNIKPIDHEKAREYVLAEHARLDGVKAAAAAAAKPAGEDSLI